MISREQADELIRSWAAEELGEIRKHWYPSTSPFLHEYSGGKYRESAPTTVPDDVGLHCAGRAVRALRDRFPRDYAVLVAEYFDGAKVGGEAKSLMLDRFALVYSGETLP